jgi:arylsulfatase A-like enzyme/Flp pilus assembly protein TadD
MALLLLHGFSRLSRSVPHDLRECLAPFLARAYPFHRISSLSPLLDWHMLRRILRSALICVLATLTTTCTNSGAGAKARRVLIVTIDTLRWDRLGFSGHDVATPNLDALAASGTTFTNAVTVAPLTLPAHSSLFTGQYPPRHGVRANGIFRLNDDAETLAEVYREAGFATGAFVGAFVLDRRFGLEQGFDHYDDELPEENPVSTAYFAERPAREIVERATAWIRARRDEPFFAWVHVFDPHAPYAAPPPFSERYPDEYDAEIAYTDHALGPLLAAVSAMDDSLVVMTSDHGESLGEHGESTHGLYIYDSTTRVPLVMTGSSVPEAHRVDSLVRIVDIAPTVAELSGLTLSSAHDGESLSPFFVDGAVQDRDAYAEAFLPRYSFNWSELRSLRRGNRKFILAPRPEVFNLETDPGETKNLWDDGNGGRSLEPEARRLVSELTRIANEDGELARALDVDEETARRLESLGYLAGSVSGVREDVERVDPKDRIEVYEHMQELLSPDLSAEESISGHRAILEVEPTNALARNRLANTLSEEGRLDEAIEEYRRLVSDSEIDFRGLENLSAALLLRSRTEEALSTTEMALASAPWNPDFHVLRGEALEQAERIAEARDAYAQAVDLEESPVNLWRLGAVLEKLDEGPEAEARYLRALEIDESFEPAVAALARLYSKTDRVDEAFALLRESPSDVDRDSAEIATAMAEAHIANGNTEEAKALLERARDEHPENTRVLALLGPLYAQEGRLTLAKETLEAALDVGETSPEVRRNLAIVYLRDGNIRGAVGQLERAVETAPDSPEVWYSLGNAYYRSGATADAVSAFEKALELRSPWPEATFNLAVAAQQIGSNDKAADAYRLYLATAPPADTRRREEADKQLRLLERERSP